ncbi:MAG TPA: lysophospholipid acyltransferase family protein [Thermoanaerobaculia bacterium]|jgi:1-acyl-sn-glycerol-3-phosphate acyltransferase|nr:lysophospholipid acyltransferase family protein [Thermoanaerobaculia bacterium]
METIPRRPPPWLTVLATFTGNLFLVIGSAILGALTVLVGWIPPRGRWAFGVMRIWSNGLLAAAMVRVEVHYAPELEPGKSYVFLCNHRSLFDIPVLLATSPGQVRMVAKRSLFLIPLFGWGLTAGRFIPVDRADRSTAGRTFAQAAERLREGTSILMFPEGTRGLTDVLLPFQRGGFLLALKSGLPIVPVGIRGTRAIQRKGSFAIRPGTAVVSYGAPIDPAVYGLRRKAELTHEVRARIAELAGLELAEEA